METNDTRTLHVERSTSTAHRLAEYDGVCGNIHGHNFEWEVEAVVGMDGTGSDNMPLDLKDVADLIDEVDHATLLNHNDPLVDQHAEGKVGVEELFGDVIWFEGDPTCEIVSKWMARRLVEEFDVVSEANVVVHETDKYGIEASHHVFDDPLMDEPAEEE